MILTTLVLLSQFAMAASDLAIPSATEVIAHMAQRDSDRQGALNGYTALRRYTLDNKSRHASMLVRTTCLHDGSKQFEVVEETGSGAIRKHVFRKMLDEESHASRPSVRSLSRINEENYTARVVGTEIVNGHSTYVMELTPKTESKYLLAGKIWVDSADYAIVRVEGKPAKSPSFWTRSVQFTHTYSKNGMFWFPSSNHSVTDVRIFGRTEMAIDYFDYQPQSVAHASAGSSAGGMQ